jgi:hypothetical protein
MLSLGGNSEHSMLCQVKTKQQGKKVCIIVTGNIVHIAIRKNCFHQMRL